MCREKWKPWRDSDIGFSILDWRPMSTNSTTSTQNAAAGQRERELEALAKVKSAFSAVHISMRHWQECMYLFSASVFFTVVALCLASEYPGNRQIQKIRIFMMAVGCALAWASQVRARMGYAIGLESFRGFALMIALRIWSFGYTVWFFIVVVLRIYSGWNAS